MPYRESAMSRTTDTEVQFQPRGRSGRARRVVLLLALAALPAACAKQVTRIDPDAVTDLSGRWNDTDSRLVANQLITESLADAWHRQHAATNAGQAPVVIVGEFRNRTMEHIPVGTFVRDLERAWIQSGAVQVVASADERAEIRAERRDQQDNARAVTRTRMAQEHGARYMMQGTIEAIEDREGRERVIYYQIDATLVDLESNLRIWTGQHRIKKYITQPRFRG
jgi:penicillin-binding protein activator